MVEGGDGACNRDMCCMTLLCGHVAYLKESLAVGRFSVTEGREWKGHKCDSHYVCDIASELKFDSKSVHYIMSIYIFSLVNTCFLLIRA